MPISNFLTVRILSKIRSLKIYDELDIDVMRYSLQTFLGETEKILILLLLFFLLGKPDYFGVTLSVLLGIRINAGGVS